ncbi:MAG: AsnC family transcriptional regulator [Gammaproteobacteria bacterium]|uniref:siroheme decarboxylase n=1 Tax=Candidatus Thiopontia autotrophica TaxID=2841688 RepID=A0A8J6NXH5_9GAMM|nr:AsnC family transcriptional regulator [Candidatus Thiopontia autotrophica]MBL6969161.1 AsnC family transcriptional regulator [Gammaproteobacteria bacterium]
MDEIDRKIIAATQSGLPLVNHPYHEVAESLGLSAEDVMERMRAMLESGIIRRIGIIPNHYKLGYKSNGMTVWDVPDEEIDTLGKSIGKLEFVSHCYQRPRHLPEWPYNLFAMVHGKTRNEVMSKAKQIEDIMGQSVRSHDILFSDAVLKKTGLRLLKAHNKNQE